MRLLAACATAVAVYMALAAAGGRLPSRPPRRRRRWPDRTARRELAAAGGLGLLSAGAAWALTATPAVGLVPGIAAALAPRAVAGRRRARRLHAVQESWPDGLRQLSAAIAAGMSLPQAVLGLAANGPAPLRTAFARFPVLLRTAGMVPALESVKAELADPTSDRVLEVLVLAHERGGRLVGDLLTDLAQATADDVRALEQIATEGLEQKINARAVFALPWLVLFTLTARPGAFRDFYQSRAGLAVVAVAGGLSLLGLWLAARLAREPVEERVLAGDVR